jgi:hypothetical protein
MKKQDETRRDAETLAIVASGGHTPRHPTLDECHAAGAGPRNTPGLIYNEGGVPNTPEERARFEAYLRGHAWATGSFDPGTNSYDTTFVRCLYGIWRDRGSLPTVWPNVSS